VQLLDPPRVELAGLEPATSWVRFLEERAGIAAGFASIGFGIAFTADARA